MYNYTIQLYKLKMLHCQQNRDIVVVDLFAGAGGLSLGLEAAGFKVAVAVEKDAINCEVYQKKLPGYQGNLHRYLFARTRHPNECDR